MDEEKHKNIKQKVESRKVFLSKVESYKSMTLKIRFREMLKLHGAKAKWRRQKIAEK